MSGEWIGWLVAAYFGGALVVALLATGSRWRSDELAALAGWPLVAPVGLLMRRYRHWRFTCRPCRRYFGTRERLQRHVSIAHSDDPGPVDEQR